MGAAICNVVATEDLEEYPIDRDTRLDSHWFIPWERRRWINSSMRTLGRPECRALYFDLIMISFDHTPLGTLPADMRQLARLSMVDETHFRDLCTLEYGPLHLWRPCLSEGERRLMHPHVLRTVLDAVSRKEHNRASSEAETRRKRLQRLRGALATYSADLAKQDQAVRWMDEWLLAQGVAYRGADQVERAMGAWQEHRFQMMKGNGNRP